MKKNFTNYLKTYRNIYECPNCHNEAEGRYGTMKCPHCGKIYTVKTRFVCVIVLLLQFTGIMQLFWSSNFFNGNALLNSLASVGLIIICNLYFGYMMYRFLPGGLYEFEEITEDVTDGKQD